MTCVNQVLKNNSFIVLDGVSIALPVLSCGESVHSCFVYIHHSHHDLFSLRDPAADWLDKTKPQSEKIGSNLIQTFLWKQVYSFSSCNCRHCMMALLRCSVHIVYGCKTCWLSEISLQLNQEKMLPDHFLIWNNGSLTALWCCKCFLKTAFTTSLQYSLL